MTNEEAIVQLEIAINAIKMFAKHEAECVSKAYHEGYEQGRFDAIADIPHGIEKGYSVVAVVRCRDCKFRNTSWYDKRDMYESFCRWDRDESPNDDDYCSYGERKEETE